MVLHLVEFLVAVGALISSTELLFIREIFRDENLLSWRVQRLTHTQVASVIVQLHVDWLFKYPGVLFIITFRAITALALAAAAATGCDTLIPIICTSLVTLLLTLRGSQGNDGSDQMGSIVLAACALGELVGTETAKEITLLFIAIESAFAYATAGFLKIPMPGWLDGSYVLDILRTGSFGNKSLLSYFSKWPLCATFFGCAVAFGDSAIAFAAVVPPPACILVLAFGVALHFGIGIVLGLNTFLWSFTSTYPAILWVSFALYAHPH
jgi:hypothetical protein